MKYHNGFVGENKTNKYIVSVLE